MCGGNLKIVVRDKIASRTGIAVSRMISAASREERCVTNDLRCVTGIVSYEGVSRVKSREERIALGLPVSIITENVSGDVRSRDYFQISERFITGEVLI